jgi:hypothetical protein
MKHYPVYKAEILYADKAVGYVEGQGEVGEIYIPERDVEVRAMALTGYDLGKHPCCVKLWVDGEWVEYYGDWVAHLSEEVEEGDEGEVEEGVEEEVDEAVEEEEEDVEEDEEGEDEEGDVEAEEDEAVRWEEDKQADDEEADNPYTNDYDHDTFME